MRTILLLILCASISRLAGAEDWVALPIVKSDYGAGGLMWRVFIDVDSVILKSGSQAQYWTKAVWTQAGRDDYKARTAKLQIPMPPAPYWVLELQTVTRDRRCKVDEIRSYDAAGKELSGAEMDIVDFPFRNILPGSRQDRCWKACFSKRTP